MPSYGIVHFKCLSFVLALSPACFYVLDESEGGRKKVPSPLYIFSGHSLGAFLSVFLCFNDKINYFSFGKTSIFECPFTYDKTFLEFIRIYRFSALLLKFLLVLPQCSRCSSHGDRLCSFHGQTTSGMYPLLSYIRIPRTVVLLDA